MKIGIIGHGVVGAAIEAGMKHVGHDVVVYDIAYRTTNVQDVLDTDACFVCVPTGSTPKGECDTSIVRHVIGDLDEHQYKGLVIIKSTVAPGTTVSLQMMYPYLRICFCPEFLKERSAASDFTFNHGPCVIGSTDKFDISLMETIHDKLTNQFIHIPPTDAEMSKYFCNTFNAMRIVFANAFYDLCEKVGADYNNVLAAATVRQGITQEYLRCGPDLRGFAGPCLPKDTEAMGALVKAYQLPMNLFWYITEFNSFLTKTVPEGMRRR